jgi:hypothetical protein
MVMNGKLGWIKEEMVVIILFVKNIFGGTPYLE